MEKSILTGKKILVVEDDSVLRQTLALKFKSQGPITLEAEDGEVGFNKAITEKPDLVVLDINLPIKNGMEVMSEIRKFDSWGANVPIILLTNLNANDQIVEGIAKDHPTFYLIKSDNSLDNVVLKASEALGGK